MGAVTTTVLMGMMVGSGVQGVFSSRDAAGRAERQAELSARTGATETRRAAQSVEQAQAELADAQGYQRWKEQFVLPALGGILERARTPNATEAAGSQMLAQGAQAGQMYDAAAQGIQEGGFAFGGNRMNAVNQEINRGIPGAGVAALAASHDQAQSAGITNTQNVIQAGRAVYKPEGLV